MPKKPQKKSSKAMSKKVLKKTKGGIQCNGTMPAAMLPMDTAGVLDNSSKPTDKTAIACNAMPGDLGKTL